MLLNIHSSLPSFDTTKIGSSKYLFLTGKGGVGKTSTACAVAVSLADEGKKVLLISTDPASNLQDVFGREFNGNGTVIAEVPGLVVINLDPGEAAANSRESVIGPYRGKMPEAVLANMEEQLSGSCTVEIAAFGQFSKFITDESISGQYDRIVFDTAPTGHTLRMLQLPSAWSNFISESTHGASCLGQLAVLQEKKEFTRKRLRIWQMESALRWYLFHDPKSFCNRGISTRAIGKARTKATAQPLKNRITNNPSNPKLIIVDTNTTTIVIIKTMLPIANSCACFLLNFITLFLQEHR